eukprot:gene20331-22331_t
MGNIDSSLPSSNKILEVAFRIGYTSLNGVERIDVSRKSENNEENLDSELRKNVFIYLANVVPLLLNIETVNGINKDTLNKEMWKDLIERALGLFICAEEPEEGLEKLKLLDNPSHICGKVFDVGEPAYTCKECSSDPTCVFCHDCFNRSTHVNHKYRMHASGGNGGYCDCGDEEAWKRDPACEIHSKKDMDIDINPKDILPTEVSARATFIYRELLQYCVDMLLWTDYDILPEELRRTESNEDEYLALMFNDEVHTYDQVIRALQQAVNCDKSEATRYASIVDKTGRSLIFHGTKEACEKVCKIVKKSTFREEHGSLKCFPIKRSIVAHQLAAIEMMKLFSKLITYSSGFRRILCELSLNAIAPRPESLLNELLRSDTELWKAARVGSHQLFMNDVLLDPYGKKEFAKSFAKNYTALMTDFIKDDHDHSLSASSLSVQIFTVPTIAQMLIVDYDILRIVFETFYRHVKEAFTDAGHIDFQNGRNRRPFLLKREYYILHDIGYLLHTKPDTWTPELMERFLAAFDVFARILRGMQGMEQVVRKLHSHVEYEPNWESGFLMQLWMMPVIEAVISWCLSNTELLKEATKRCLTILLEKLPALKYEPKCHPEVDPNFILVNYDVATQPASVHMGLSRFMAGLFGGCYRNGISLEQLFQIDGPTNAQSTEKLLALCEYPLRTLVFAAQVSAGMWRRNGYVVMHQVSYYQNVRCVSEMYDKDIITLQAVAALMNSNHFLTVLLEKYGLLDWLRLGFEETSLDEDAQRRIIVISEEFLLTVLAVVGERHVLGIGKVTAKEILRKEVVHRLALGPASRSELVKNLPSKDPDDEDDCTFESQLDDVLRSVADFRQPKLDGKGLYDLKTECLSECGQYFYHYSRIEQSKALEQRRKKSKISSNTEWTVPVPATFTPPFSPITKIFCCDKMAKILAVVLFRASKSESKITPDTLIEEALYIVALGLFEERRKRENHEVSNDNFLNVVTRTLGVVDGKPVTIKGLLEDLQVKHNNQEYSELVQWIIQMLSDELAHVSQDKDDSNLQSKRKQDEIDHGVKADKERRARMAKNIREKVMAQMSQMQKSFIKKHEHVLDLEDDWNSNLEDVDMEESLNVAAESVAVGLNRTHVRPKTANIICILCQEKEDITPQGRTVVMAAFVQRSNVMSQHRRKSIHDVTDHNPLFTPRDLITGVFTSSCGHVMHADCWQKYFDSVLEREGRRHLRLHFNTRVDASKEEYICPLCSSLCNTVIPWLPGNDLKDTTSSEMEHEDADLFTGSLNILFDIQKKLRSMPATSPTAEQIQSSPMAYMLSLLSNVLPESSASLNGARSMIAKFSDAVNKASLGSSGSQDHMGTSEFVLTWNTCAYTIQCTECLLRSEKKPLFALSSRQTDCIKSLVRYAIFSSSSLANMDNVKNDCLKLLAALLPSETSQNKLPSILDLNIFGIMLNLRFALQPVNLTDANPPMARIISRGALDEVLLKLCTQAQIVQILLCCSEEIPPCDEPLRCLGNSEVKKSLSEFWGRIRSAVGLSSSPEHHSQPDMLFCYVISQCLPFLRCSALFYHFLTDISPPSLLVFESDSLSQADSHEHSQSAVEVAAICNYLSLPTNVVGILPFANDNDESIEVSKAIIERWFTNESIEEFLKSPRYEQLIMPLSSVSLIPLPKEYSQLITRSSGFKCPMTGDISQNPTMCLVCGEMLCSQSYCCQALVDEWQIGSCTAHAAKCNETVGIFLRIRDCQLLLLYNKTKGCFKQSPYLDEYGEADYKLRRGNPLYLSETRYNNLQMLWLSHLIPEEIARQVEQTKAFLAYEWAQY